MRTFRAIDILLCACLTAGLCAAVLSGFTPEEAPRALWPALGGSAVAAFALTRTRPGCIVLFLLGSLLCAGAYFLEFPIPLWSFLLFELAACAAFLWRTWYVSARRAEAGNTRFGAPAAQTALLCVLAFAAAGGLYYGVVRPLDPPTRELKLIRELKSMELLRVLGVARTEIVLDPELSGETPPEDEEQGDVSGEDESEAPDDTAAETPPPPEAAGEDRRGSEAAMAIRYDLRGFPWGWLLLLLPAALALAYALRARRARRWREGVRALGNADAAVNYYRFLLARLGRAGYPRPPQQTLEEYAAANAAGLEPFAPVEGGFPRLTAVYERALYGRGAVDDAERALFEAAFDAFPAALKREKGAARYYLTLLWN